MSDKKLRLGDGGGGQDELRPGAVVGADAPQPSQHLGHVAAHDAPVGVDFINHHELEAGKKAGPGGVIGQQPHMQHVGLLISTWGGFALMAWRWLGGVSPS